MKEKRIFTVTDLGGGDGGKGGIVHKLCTLPGTHTVLKVGGAQGSHGVRTSRGESFNFSQFGCGTFEGVRTHITKLMVIEPVAILAEGNCLKFEHGVHNAFDLLTVDADCLCATPFHGIASRLRELARKESQKGTVGVGIGEAKLDSEINPELAIYARDLSRPDIFDKVEAVRQQKIAELRPIIEGVDELWVTDRDIARHEIKYLLDPGFTRWIVGEFSRVVAQVKIVPSEYLEDVVLSQDGSAVVESSHGILTDKYYGFHPYVSRLRTMPAAIHDLLKMRGYDGELIRLGVTRAYQIRHGAGPLVTESPELVEKLLPGSHKNNNRWQGSVRVGPLDFVALRYAINACGGPSAFDGIAVSWFDQILENGEWLTCNRYTQTNQEFFTSYGNIQVMHGENDIHVEYQRRLSQALFACSPEISIQRLESSFTQDDAIDLCSDTLRSKLGVPVKMISFGSTEDRKVCL